MPTKKKVNLSKEAEYANAAEVQPLISDADLLELCPKYAQLKFKAAKTPAARADLLYTLSNNEWKALKKEFDAMDAFLGKLEQWFIQEFESDQKGVTGKVGRVEVKDNIVPVAEDWNALYVYIKKNNAFELLNRAVNKKAVQERWDQNKTVPGIGKFNRKKISLTGVKK